MEKNTLLFYDDFNLDSARKFNTELFQLDRNTELEVRMSTPGGDVETGGEAMIAGLSEITAKKTVIIDGIAASMGAILLLYFDEVIVNDAGIPKIMFHKAAFPSWYKPSEDQKLSLARLNDGFEQRLKKKVDGKEGAVEFLAKVFEKDKRNDVYLTAEEAVKLGIATSIRKIEPTAYEGVKIVAKLEQENTTTTKVEPTINEKPKRMEITQAQLEAARKEGFDAGVQAEFDRAGSFLAWAEIDPKEAIEGAITFGAKVTATKIAKFQIAAMKSNRLEAHKEDNTPPNGITPENPAKGEMTAEQKETATIEAEMKEMRKLAGLQ